MMKKLLLLVVLAGCGADGAPFKPSANLGLSIGSNGVTTNASVGASNGPVTISIGN